MDRTLTGKSNSFEVRLVYIPQWQVFVLPWFRHRTSTAEDSRRDRPSPCRRPLPILISTKAGLYITGGADGAVSRFCCEWIVAVGAA